MYTLNGWKTPTNTYLIEFVSIGMKFDHYIVDGNILQDLGKYVFKHVPEIKHVRKQEKAIGYKNSSNAELTLDEYNKIVANLFNSKVIYDDEFDHPKFPEIEDEVAWKRFEQLHWKPIYEAEFIETDIELSIFDINDSENKYIIPYRMIDANIKDKDLHMFMYTPNLIELVRNIGKSYGFEEVDTKYSSADRTKGKKFSVPAFPNNRDNPLRYVSINGTYINQNLNHRGITIGTYEECLNRFNLHKNFIVSIFKLELESLNNVGISIVDRKLVMKELESILNNVNQIDSKVKTHKIQQTVINKVRNLMTTISESLNTEE